MSDSNNCCSNCQQVWNISLQLAMWFIIIWCALVGYQRGGNLHSGEIFALVIIYIIYEINFFCYKSFKYLNHKFKKTTIHDYMKELFYTPVDIIFHIECYHYETRYSGNKLRRVKVVSHRDTEKFHYYTWRDISGVFKLETDLASNKHKPYIQLDLKFDLDFADDVSRYDFEEQKKRQLETNRGRDEHVNQWESRDLKGLNENNLIKVTKKDVLCISVFWYVTFTVIPVLLIYDWYFLYNCMRQEFGIKKVASTRYDLSSAENNQRFLNNIPKILIQDEEIHYDEAPGPIHRNPTLPNAEELAEAQRFIQRRSGININNLGENATDPFPIEHGNLNLGAPGIGLANVSQRNIINNNDAVIKIDNLGSVREINRNSNPNENLRNATNYAEVNDIRIENNNEIIYNTNNKMIDD